jgi:hypothetical protein
LRRVKQFIHSVILCAVGYYFAIADENGSLVNDDTFDLRVSGHFAGGKNLQLFALYVAFYGTNHVYVRSLALAGYQSVSPDYQIAGYRDVSTHIALYAQRTS